MSSLDRTDWVWGSVITSDGVAIDVCTTAYDDALVVTDEAAECATIANIYILDMINNGGGDGSRQIQN